LGEPGFHPYEGFRAVGLAGQSHLSSEDLNTFMKANNIYLSFHELQALTHALDHDRDGRISYADWIAVWSIPPFRLL
jgi:Ca2+-binding EF-hand superfamily protein